MEYLFQHSWVLMVVFTWGTGLTWWKWAQSRIRTHPELEPGYRRLYRGYLIWMNLPWLTMGLGILIGEVHSTFEFLRPAEGNSFVLIWWGLLAVLLGAGTYWMFAGGGAEMLERHPGVYMVPQWPAAKLRLAWLGVVVWNVAIGAVLFFGFPGSMDELPIDFSWFWVLFPVFFVGMWLLGNVFQSALSRWRALAHHYGVSSRFSGHRFRFRSAQFGSSARYGACLTLGAAPSGLYLAVLPVFRFAHPPLMIPWSDITARESRNWGFSTIELEIDGVPGATIRLSSRLARALFEASGTQVPVQPAA